MAAMRRRAQRGTRRGRRASSSEGSAASASAARSEGEGFPRPSWHRSRDGCAAARPCRPSATQATAGARARTRVQPRAQKCSVNIAADQRPLPGSGKAVALLRRGAREGQAGAVERLAALLDGAEANCRTRQRTDCDVTRVMRKSLCNSDIGGRGNDDPASGRLLG